MRANSPGAFFLSLTLHASVAALIVFFSYAMHRKVQEEAPKIFELVAGEGNNYAATKAPAAGGDNNDDVVTFNMPKITRPARPDPSPVKPAPESEPVIQTAPEPVKTTPRKTETKPQPKAPAKTMTQPAQTRTLTKAEFDRLHGSKPNPTAVNSASASRAPKVKTIDIKGVVGGTGSEPGAGGTALTREEGNLLDAYIALLLQRLRAAHIKPAGLSDLLQTKVRFSIAANGTLSNVRIITSSGSREFDQSVLEAFAKVRSIGPTPNGKSDVWEVTFKMREDG